MSLAAMAGVPLTSDARAASDNGSPSTQPAAKASTGEGRIAVARLKAGGENAPVCLAADFLTLAARQTKMPIDRDLHRVGLASNALFDYPFVIFTGARRFTLNQKQQARLKQYLDRGGFILASASCSNAPWASSFTRLIESLYPEKRLTPIGAKHPVRHTLFDIERIDTRRPTRRPALRGLTIGDRLAMVFSPVGLNDTANAGGGCCCCGGNEITDAAPLNANILIYALTH